MDKYKKKNIITLGGLIAGCVLIVFFGFNSETKGEGNKAVQNNDSNVTLTSVHKATEVKLQSLKLDNMDFSNAKKIPDIDTLYKGIFYLPDTSSIVKKRAVSYFKKQSEEMKRTYNKKFLRPYNKRYVPLGRDYQVDDDNGMSYSTTGFFTCFENFDGADLNLPYIKEEDLVGDDRILQNYVLKKKIEEVHKLMRNTGCTFDVQLIPHLLRTSKNNQGKEIKELSFQISYRGIPFSDMPLNSQKCVTWSGCDILWVADEEKSKAIILSKMTLKPKKIQEVKRIISAEDAVNYLSRKLAGYHKYEVSSMQMEYVSTLTDKEIKEGKQNLYLNPFVEGGEYVVKPYWVIYFNVSEDNSAVGYVNAENGEVLFVNRNL